MSQCYLEIACFDVESAHIAARAGASRIELCANYEVGGTTPVIEADALLALKIELSVPIFVMIRPRGGVFQYCNEEYETMRRDIKRLREAADGFVFGVLDQNNSISVEKNRLLISDANGKPCTMHRAFDETPNLIESLAEVIECGFTTLLTSGGASTATSGILNLKALVEKADRKISIMPGGGIRRNNIEQIKAVTGAEWFHSAARGENGQLDIGEINALRSKIGSY